MERVQIDATSLKGRKCIVVVGAGRRKEGLFFSCLLQQMTREQRPLSLLQPPTVFQSWSDLKSVKRRFSTGSLSVQPPSKTATKNQKYPIS